VLSRFGIQTTSLVALLGAAGLAIGLALQGTLSNLAAGVMLLGFRPFKIGDYVDVGGHSGSVKAITLFTTEIATSDNVQITIPNGDIWASSIKNYSYYDRRRCDIVIGVSYDTDLKKAEAALRKVIEADERALSDPAPFVKVTNLGDSSVDFTIRVWAMADGFWDMKFAMLREIKEEFDRQEIDIPFPTSVHIVNG
jgi:small conductance mechanosensitive channel